MTAVAFERHDHKSCIRQALTEAESRCERSNLRLTTVRRRVLEILLQQHTAMGAYEILERLNEEGLGSQPPVSYRALEFLVQLGVVHKIEKRNAFVACSHPGKSHTPVFMICRICNAVAETAAQAGKSSLGHVARESGFKIEETVVEAEGVCPSCIPGED